MPRYESQNLAAVDPEFRKKHNISLAGNAARKSNYMYSQQGGDGILIASGADLFSHGLCLRLLPIYSTPADVKNQQFVEFRATDGTFGDWCRLVTCAHWVGNPGVCFIIHDGNPEISLYDSPYHVLRNVVYRNSSNSKNGVAHPVLGRLCDDLLSNTFAKDSHVGSLKKAEQILFVSAGLVFLNDAGRTALGPFDASGDDKLARKRHARIVGLKTSAASSLLSALRVQDERTHEFASGDMLSFSGAKLITFLPDDYKNSDGKNRMALSAAGITGVQVPPYIQQSNPLIVGYPPARSSFTHFAVIHETYNGQEINLEPYAERIVAETVSWDDQLYVPSYDEQAEILASRFPREILDFAWREHPQYARHIPRNTTTAFVGETADDDGQFSSSPAIPVASRETAPKAPPAPWDPPSEELSAEDSAGLTDIFSAPSSKSATVPGASFAPPPPPPSAAASANAAGKPSSAEILARAKARAAANK